MAAEAETRDAGILGSDKSLLIVDDDKPFLTRLARAMEIRGFVVDTAESVEEAVQKARANAPAYAVVDMRLGDGNGLDVVEAIREKRADSRTVILTGYGNIATAVTAVKLGAIDYLSKPADADDVFAALTRNSSGRVAPPGEPDVCRSCPLGTHPARLRNVRTQRVGDRAAAQHAPAHPAAHPCQTRAALKHEPEPKLSVQQNVAEKIMWQTRGMAAL